MGSLLFFLYKVKQRHLALQYNAFLVFRQKRIQTSSLCANPTPQSSFKGVLDSRTNSGSVSSVASALLPAPVYWSPLFFFSGLRLESLPLCGLLLQIPPLWRTVAEFEFFASDCDGREIRYFNYLRRPFLREFLFVDILIFFNLKINK